MISAARPVRRAISHHSCTAVAPSACRRVLSTRLNGYLGEASQRFGSRSKVVANVWSSWLSNDLYSTRRYVPRFRNRPGTDAQMYSITWNT
jgi:hypothetical protein